MVKIDKLSDDELRKYFNILVAVLKKHGILTNNYIKKWKDEKSQKMYGTYNLCSTGNEYEDLKSAFNWFKNECKKLWEIINDKRFVDYPYSMAYFGNEDKIIPFKDVAANWKIFFGVMGIRYMTMAYTPEKLPLEKRYVIMEDYWKAMSHFDDKGITDGDEAVPVESVK